MFHLIIKVIYMTQEIEYTYYNPFFAQLCSNIFAFSSIFFCFLEQKLLKKPITH